MKIEDKAVNNLRVFACEMISNAKSGHSGIVLSSAPIIYTLFAKHYKNSPKDPTNILRDRFVLSAGHGSAILYTILHCMGYDVKLKDLQNFRKLGHITSGHPELDVKIGVECTTGPLGQGVATAVGMALGLKMQAKYNKPDCKLFDNKVYTLVGDGCLMEGVSYEALSLAGTLKLDNLIVLYDSNNNTLDSDTSNTFGLDTKKYIEALGFEYIRVENGNSVDEIDKAISLAKKCNKPAFVEVKTQLGFGSDLQGKYSAHGLVMSTMQIEELRRNLGVKSSTMQLADDVVKLFEKIKANNTWDKVFKDKLNYYKTHYKKEFKELQQELNNQIEPISYDNIDLNKEVESTRNIGGLVLNKLCEKNHQIVGGNADLSSCTKAIIKNSSNIEKEKFDARNIFFGVREFGMSCITNGLQLVGYKAFAGTFMVFSDYMRSAIRSSAIMKLPVTYILTHDSIAVGEDGPTHQPIEQLDSFRVMPNLNVFRPCNVEETVMAYNLAFSSEKTPSVISLTRQPIKLYSSDKRELNNIVKGGYVFAYENNCLDYVLVATGSEVSIAMEVKKNLEPKGKGVRVVSVPCLELFLQQTDKYIEKVIPKTAKNKVAIEASTNLALSRLVGDDGKVIKVDSFGLSGAMQDVYKHFGIVAEDIVKKIK